MSQERNYYELLGVTREASIAEIKEAYREIARVYHPDSNFYDEIIADSITNEASDTFKEITAAYNTLIHAGKREAYNQTLPPELTDWEGKSNEEEDQEEWLNRKHTHPSYAMGTFGSVELRSRRLRDQQAANVQSMAQMMQRESWFNRLLALFGLA